MGGLGGGLGVVWRLTSTGVDTTFGEQGIAVHTTSGSEAYQTGVLVDGSLIAIGHWNDDFTPPSTAFATWAHTDTGAVDSSMATDGRYHVGNAIIDLYLDGGQHSFRLVSLWY